MGIMGDNGDAWEFKTKTQLETPTSCQHPLGFDGTFGMDWIPSCMDSCFGGLLVRKLVEAANRLVDSKSFSQDFLASWTTIAH